MWHSIHVQVRGGLKALSSPSTTSSSLAASLSTHGAISAASRASTIPHAAKLKYDQQRVDRLV